MNDTPALDDDPVFGAAIANFPSNRARLLAIGGAILVVVWLAVTFALLGVDEGAAAIITVLVMGLTTIVVGWYVAHLWNREVVLFARGFSYREGSYNAYILYDDVRSFRQHAERQAYFGGLIRRSVYRFSIQTIHDETIVLTGVYRRVNQLGARLESCVIPVVKARMERQLAEGKPFDFAATLSVTRDGLCDGERDLRWDEFGGCKVQGGRLNLFRAGDDSPWFSIALAEVDNLALLVTVLNERKPAYDPRA